MIKIELNRTEYMHLVSEKLDLVEKASYGICFNNGMIDEITSPNNPMTSFDQLNFINDHINTIFGNGYDLTIKDLLISRKSLFVSNRNKKTSLNLFGLYDALLTKGHIEPKKSDNKVGYIYRVEDKNSKGPYQRASVKSVDILDCNPSPREDMAFCSFLYSRITDPNTRLGTTISKNHLFGFKDIKSLKNWFLKNKELNEEVSGLNFNIVKIKINKNDIIYGDKQLMFNADKMLDKNIVCKYKKLPSLKIRKSISQSI